MRINHALRAAATGGGGGVTTDPYFNNTTLLLNGDGTNGAQNNTFVDSSTNNFTITRNGNVTQGSFSPFAKTAPYDASASGGSIYFDGSGDSLTVPDSAAFDFSGDFTIECFVNPSSNPAIVYFMGQYEVSDYAAVLPYFVSGVPGIAATSNKSSFFVNANAGPALGVGQWHHVAWVRSGNKWSVYVNGIERVLAANTAGTPYNSTAPLTIGLHPINSPYPYNGYISNLRILKGTALYTSNFTPPTAPLTAVTNTSLLLNAVNGGIIDATASNVLETVGNAQVSTVQKKYGTGALSFDGTGDWLLLPHNANQLFGTGNFTLELWLYLSATGAARGLVGKGTATTGWLVSTDSSNRVVFTFGSTTLTSAGAISASTWTHIAVVREGTGTNQTKIYIGGTNDGTGTVSTDFNQTNSAYVGANRTGGDALNGYIDDLRITKGVARYTANFTPPTAALPLL